MKHAVLMKGLMRLEQVQHAGKGPREINVKNSNHIRDYRFLDVFHFEVQNRLIVVLGSRFKITRLSNC
jgi:hypothetical protein